MRSRNIISKNFLFLWGIFEVYTYWVRVKTPILNFIPKNAYK